jgi:hypothetical protein
LPILNDNSNDVGSITLSGKSEKNGIFAGFSWELQAQPAAARRPFDFFRGFA